MSCAATPEPCACPADGTRPRNDARAAYGFGVLIAAALALLAVAGLSPSRPAGLLLSFTTFRDRPAFTNVYFYEHDGVAHGRIVGSVAARDETADYHPSLAVGGALCACASKQAGGVAGLINLWDRTAQRMLPLPAFNEGFGARVEPMLTADGNLLSFSSWQRAGSAGGWDVFLYDVRAQKLIDLPGLNTAYDEREPAISGDGRYLAFVSNRPGGKGLSDIYLYDRSARTLLPLPGLNTAHREINPALSNDGSLLAFVSDRPGGAGGKDVYLYDRTRAALIALPGLNAVGDEQTPALSPDGRFLAFVSERTSGMGERDIYLYDRQTARLLPTPGLNSRQEDFDPHLTIVNSN